MKTRLVVLALITLFGPAAARANGLLQKLPTDGAWVRYFIDLKTGQAEGDQTGSLIVRSVGQEMVKGEPCRWIEFEFKSTKEPEQENQIFKTLIPEKQLQPAANPSDNIIRGWTKSGNDDPRELAANNEMEAVRIFLPGPLKDRKNVAGTKVVDYQRGQLKCESAITGEHSVQLTEDLSDGVGFTLKYHIWPHTTVPFGTAAMTMNMQIKRGDELIQTITIDFIMEDFGADAKSALPDKK